MYKCKTCGKFFKSDWRKEKNNAPKYCSISCSKSRKKSKNIRNEIANKLRKKPIRYCLECNIKILSINNKSGVCMKCQNKIKKEIKLGIITDCKYKFKYNILSKSESSKNLKKRISIY